MWSTLHSMGRNMFLHSICYPWRLRVSALNILYKFQLQSWSVDLNFEPFCTMPCKPAFAKYWHTAPFICTATYYPL